MLSRILSSLRRPDPELIEAAENVKDALNELRKCVDMMRNDEERAIGRTSLYLGNTNIDLILAKLRK